MDLSPDLRIHSKKQTPQARSSHQPPIVVNPCVRYANLGAVAQIVQLVSAKKRIQNANVAINHMKAKFLDLNNAFITMEMGQGAKNVGIRKMRRMDCCSLIIEKG